MNEKYKPEQGDRVRVVLEGEVRSSSSSGGGFWVGDPGESNHLFHDASHVVSIEKLAPPEPKWVYGAVVQVEEWLPAIYDGRVWRAPSGGVHAASSLDVSLAWENGILKVLWNGGDND